MLGTGGDGYGDRQPRGRADLARGRRAARVGPTSARALDGGETI